MVVSDSMLFVFYLMVFCFFLLTFSLLSFFSLFSWICRYVFILKNKLVEGKFKTKTDMATKQKLFLTSYVQNYHRSLGTRRRGYLVGATDDRPATVLGLGHVITCQTLRTSDHLTSTFTKHRTQPN